MIVEGDILRANNTTLGGDDGIAVAYGLAILDSDDLNILPLNFWSRRGKRRAWTGRWL